MPELDLELSALFDLNDSPVQQPRCENFVALDKAFECVDYQLPDAVNAFTKNDADLVEISIENGRVVRKYRSKS
jgi:hypothetical protein